MRIKAGVSVVKVVTLYGVQIDGRGGDSVHDEYFEKEEDAILASAVDGPGRKPEAITAYALSDGRHMKDPRFVSISSPPTEEQVAKLREQLTPAQRILMARKAT